MTPSTAPGACAHPLTLAARQAHGPDIDQQVIPDDRVTAASTTQTPGCARRRLQTATARPAGCSRDDDPDQARMVNATGPARS